MVRVHVVIKHRKMKSLHDKKNPNLPKSRQKDRNKFRVMFPAATIMFCA